MSEDLGQIRKRYERDGYVIIRNVIDQALIQEARSHIEWLTRKQPDKPTEANYERQLHSASMTNDPFWVHLVGNDGLLDVAEAFIGPNLALFSSNYIVKPPHEGKAVQWHQDGSFWPLEPMEVVSLWLAIDDTTPENGCMRVIPGTHNMKLQEIFATEDADNYVLTKGMDPALVDEAQAVNIELQAGDVSIHHPNVIHGSNANTSPRWRPGLIQRYIPTSTRILTENPESIWPNAFLLRGEAVPGVNKYNPWPKFVGGRHMPFRGWEAWNRRLDTTG